MSRAWARAVRHLASLPLEGGRRFVLGGLLFGNTNEGARLIAAGLSAKGGAWVVYALARGAAMTGDAVLRATGRILVGLGPDPGSEKDTRLKEAFRKGVCVVPAHGDAALRIVSTSLRPL